MGAVHDDKSCSSPLGGRSELTDACVQTEPSYYGSTLNCEENRRTYSVRESDRKNVVPSIRLCRQTKYTV